MTDANGNKAELRYDGFDHQVRWVFPSKTTDGALNEGDYEAYTYDAAGNRLTLRKRDATTIAYAYDNLNRMKTKSVPTSASGAAGYGVHYDYDNQGKQTYARLGSATGVGIAYNYDGLGRLLSTTNNMGGTSRTLSYLYDGGGRRSRLTFPDSVYFSYDYDTASALTGIRENASTTQVAAFSYDSASRPWKATYAGAVTTMGYDGVSRLASLGHDLYGTASDQTLSFAYNPASQIATRTSANDAYAWTDAYDVNRSYSVNGLNQYTAAGPASFCYDANGNLTSDGSTVYRYDAENRLVEARAAVSTACPVSYTGALKASLVYDPLGRLFETSGGSAGVTRFLYDADELVAEYSGTGTLLRRYAHGRGIDDPVLWYEGATLTGRRSMFRDHQGSIVAVADALGSKLTINSYDPWGIPAATNAGRFQYTGQAWVPELGMYYYKARIYSPTLGRFLQTDPIGYKDEANLYSYVRNDPMNGRDPTGLETYDCTSSKSACPKTMYIKDMKPGDIIKTKHATIHIGKSTKSESQIGTVVTFRWGKQANGSDAARKGPIIVPIAPKGADVDANMDEAEGRMLQPNWFYNQVKNKAPWDYKQQGRRYEQFGNFNYGATGWEVGFPGDVLLQEAGRAHQIAENEGAGTPGLRGLPGTGTPPYGDDPVDQFWIMQGIRYAQD